MQVFSIPLAFDLSHLDLCSWQVWAAVAALLVIGGIGQYIVWRRRLARVQRLRGIAAQFQIPFHDVAAFHKPKFPPFQRGVRRFTLNSFVGPFHGRDIQMGDYHFEIPKEGSDGERSVKHYYFSYCYIRVREALFVDLSVRPETALDRVRAVAGHEDINFESHQFSKQYYVQSLDRKFAYDVITPQMMEYLLERPGYELHLNHDGLLVLKGQQGADDIWKPEDFIPAAQFAVNVLRRIPAHVWDTYKANSAPHR